MVSAAHGTITLRASPRLYRGKVLLLALAIAVVSLAEALRTTARHEAATPTTTDIIERIVLDEADTVAASESAAPAGPEAECAEATSPLAAPLPASCAACDCDVRTPSPAPRAS